jgi:hypothetical protein
MEADYTAAPRIVKMWVSFASSCSYNHLIKKQPSGGCMVNVSDGAKTKLLEYLKSNNSDLAVRVILSHG